MEARGFERRIGLAGGVFTLVGLVIGASIFILPGELAGAAGPGVWLAYLAAGVPALFTCVVSAQVANVFPVAGATYVAVSRTLGPLWGALLVWSLMTSLVVGIPLIALGFADYLILMAPGAPRIPVALAILGLTTAVNLLDLRLSVGAQAAMTAGFLAALLAFGIGGLPALDPGRLTPLFPRGLGPAAGAAVAAYFSYVGFFAIIEIAGEIRDPERTIPRILLIGFGCVLAVYALVSLVLPGLVPWEELARTPASIGAAASLFLPRWAAGAITVGALLAAATTLNAILLTISRDIFALARDRIFPEALAHVDERFGVPDRAVMLIGILGAAGILVGAEITSYAVATVLGFMLVQTLTGLAVLRMPAAFPRRWAASSFRLGPFALRFFGGGLIAISLAFAAVGAAGNAEVAAAYLLLLLPGAAFYAWRRRALAGRGIDVDSLLDGAEPPEGGPGGPTGGG